MTGRDGAGRAEVHISAFDAARPGQAPAVASTGPTGAYTLTLAAGTYVVVATDAALETRWFPDAAEPAAADRVTVPVGTGVAGVSFRLGLGPAGVVAGRVQWADGHPAAGALVSAVGYADPSDPDDPGSIVTTGLTDSVGKYRLRLEPGLYAFAAHPTWSSPAAVWWDGRPSAGERDLCAVGADARVEGVDFTLP